MIERLVVRCEKEYKDKVVEAAKQQGITTTAFIRLLINKELKRLEKENK